MKSGWNLRWVMSFVLLSMNYHSRFVQGLFRPIHKIRLSTRGKSGKRCICVCSLRDGIFQNQWTPKLVRVHLSAARRQWLVLWCSYLTARWGLKAAFCQPFSSETARTSRLEHYFHLPRINYSLLSWRWTFHVLGSFRFYHFIVGDPSTNSASFTDITSRILSEQSIQKTIKHVHPHRTLCTFLIDNHFHDVRFDVRKKRILKLYSYHHYATENHQTWQCPYINWLTERR